MAVEVGWIVAKLAAVMGKGEIIQMGGMSRMPSSRLVRDGMASESLNLAVVGGEVVPVTAPPLVEGDDIPDSWGDNGEMVFVHVQPAYEHHVYQVGQGIGVWVPAYDDEGNITSKDFTPFMEMAEGETLNGVVNVGNTLVVSTSEATHYVLWKDGSYRDLGTELPKPAVVFYGGEEHQTVPGQWGDYVQNHACSSEGQRVSRNDDGEYDDDEIRRRIWDAYDDAVAKVAEVNGSVMTRMFYQPYLFRYALRLYDETYARQSVPVLVGGDTEWPQLVGTYEDGDDLYGGATVWMYYAGAQLLEEVPEDWSDIVTAIDIFCSSPVNAVDPGDGGITAGRTVRWYMAGEMRDVTSYAREGSQVEDVLVNHNVFYRIGSFLIDNDGFPFSDSYDEAVEFTANQSDLRAGIRLHKPDADTLVTHTSTASSDWDDYEADHSFHGNAQRVMNQRLAIWDIDKTLGSGLPVLSSCTAVTTVEPEGGAYTPSVPVYEYRVMYEVETDGGTRRVWGRYLNGDRDILPVAGLLFNGSGTVYANAPAFLLPCGWLAYPDAKCRRMLYSRMEVTSCTGQTCTTAGVWSAVRGVPMKEHPFLNCAYAWLGYAVELDDDAGTEVSDEDAELFWDGPEDRAVRDANTVMLSGAANPFTFPTAGRYTFDYAVVSCATANMPLSTGQFGQFSLYVFTKGGIWAMSMNADGTFASSAPFSRDVAVSNKGVCEIDQGIVFITSKAVMALQGGQTADISSLMTGRHDPLPQEAADALVVSGFGDDVPVSALSGAWTDGSDLMAFMADAAAGYDYVGNRMVFINGEYDWQWVWMRQEASWHRTMLHGGDWGLPGLGTVVVRSLVNSWPGLIANLAGTGGGECAVGEMTGQLDPTRDEGLASTGLYVSRPLTLSAPDVFKSIMDLRIRGDLKRGNAKRLLLSSNNGHDWVLRRSLRGPSFRFHRIAVVTRMTARERISYIEVQKQERLGARMR